jgi:hypothetical protein
LVARATIRCGRFPYQAAAVGHVKPDSVGGGGE